MLGSHWDAHATDPAVHAAVVTPSDTTDLANVTTGIFVSAAAAATLAVNMLGGEGPVGFAFAAGYTGVLPIRATRILATGTNFTNIVALWR